MRKPPQIKRRCQCRDCTNWVLLDPLNPADNRRYCSHACERADTPRHRTAAEQMALIDSAWRNAEDPDYYVLRMTWHSSLSGM